MFPYCYVYAAKQGIQIQYVTYLVSSDEDIT